MRHGRHGARGFTLIEVMLVVVLIAVVSALASLSLRDPATTRLEQEGARLVALLESARAEARASGLAVVWEPVPADPAKPGAVDFRFVGLPSRVALPTRWLEPGVVAQIAGAPTLVLGPEPMIGAQRLELRLDKQRLALATDGLGPFVPVTEANEAEGPK